MSQISRARRIISVLFTGSLALGGSAAVGVMPLYADRIKILFLASAAFVACLGFGLLYDDIKHWRDGT